MEIRHPRLAQVLSVVLVGLFSIFLSGTARANVVATDLAWQTTPPLSLTLIADPAVALSEELLKLYFTLTNNGSSPLEQVQLQVSVPEGTAFEGATVGSKWAVSTPPRGERGTVSYVSLSAIAPQEQSQLSLWLIVRQDTGGKIVLDDYTATVEGFASPIAGDPATIWVGITPTPVVNPTSTPTPAPTFSATPSVTATSTVPATATSTPRPTTTPSPTPSPTVTVVIAELPPTPTPNLTTEQERLGTLTVSIFVFLTLAIAAFATIWLVRKRVKDKSKAG